MASRLQRPMWRKALRERGIAEDEARGVVRAHRRRTTCRGRRAPSPACSATSSPGASPTASTSAAPTASSTRRARARSRRCRMAINELQLGAADLVITGGVDTMNDIFMYMCFSKTPALSPTGDCRPFSDDGRRHDARRGHRHGRAQAPRRRRARRRPHLRGDPRHRHVAPTGGRRASTRRVPEGQARALRRAYEAPATAPTTVELVEAHGTGTKAGDAAEFDGAARRCSTRRGRADRQWCALGSVKSQIGHTKAAAGAAGLFKAVLALHHKVLPPTIKVERAEPGARAREQPVLPEHRGAAVDPRRRASAPRRRSARSASAASTSTSRSRSTPGPTPRAARVRAAPERAGRCCRADSRPALADALPRRRHAGDASALAGQLARRQQAPSTPRAPARLAVVAASDGGAARQARRRRPRSARRGRSAVLDARRASHYGAARADRAASPSCSPARAASTSAWAPTLAMRFDAARARLGRARPASHFDERARCTTSSSRRPRSTDDERDAQQATALTATEWAQPALGVQSLALLRRAARGRRAARLRAPATASASSPRSTRPARSTRATSCAARGAAAS